MSQLSPDSMELLDAARAGDDPSADDRSRVRAALARQIAVGVAVAATATAAAKTAGGVVSAGAAGAGAGVAVGAASTAAGAGGGAVVGGGAIATGAGLGGFGAKLLVSVAIVGAVSAGTVGTAKMVRHREEERARVAHVQAAEAQAASVAASSRARAESIPPPPSEEELRAAALEQAPAIPAAEPAPAIAAPRAPAQAAISPLDAELGLLRTAHEALKDHDPAAALRTLDEHARRFPEGVMVEEREASRVFALCDLGRKEEAADAASRFLREHASSRSPRAFRTRATALIFDHGPAGPRPLIWGTAHSTRARHLA